MKLFNQAAQTPLYPACPTLTILCFVEGGVHDVPKSVGAANHVRGPAFMYEAPLVLGFASGNVAGPRASKEPGIASFVILTLDAVFGF